MELLVKIVMVAVGSAVGGLTRWGVSLAFARMLVTAFPWGTLVINIVGSFFLGWFATFMERRMELQENGWLSTGNLYLLIAVGFTGAYTTFSSYEFEAHGLFEKGEGWWGMLYLCASVVLGLIAVRCGVLLARQ